IFFHYSLHVHDANRDIHSFPTRRSSDLLEEALRIAPGRRQAYLDLVCGPDSELRAEVESLIASHEEAGSAFLDAAAPELLELTRSEEHTSELQSLRHLVCRLLLEKKKK